MRRTDVGAPMPEKESGREPLQCLERGVCPWSAARSGNAVNPDVFELVRGRTATAQACLVEVMGITAKLPSGYQRDLQLIKAPLFRSVDLCGESLSIMAAAIPALRFRPERIRMDADIHASAEANALVAEEGIPFREAYRRIGAKYRRGD